MITIDDIKKRLNAIFPSDKWIVYRDDNYFDYSVIWIKIKGKHIDILTLGYIRISRTPIELDKILSKVAILRDLIAFGIIRKNYKIVKKTV